MTAYPSLNTQVIGQAESALGALWGPLSARAGTTFHQWLVLTVTAASGSVIDRGQLIARITGARKLDDSEVEAAISELITAGLVQPLPGDLPRVGLTDAGQARYLQIRAALDEITARLFGDLPPEDLTTAGRVLTIVTARANAELANL
jgi:DNA-binding MarR family transcriptional regulator